MKITFLRWSVIPLLLGLALTASSAGAQQSPPSQPAGTAAPSKTTTLGFQANEWFPRVLSPYTSPSVSAPPISNSPLLHSLIREGKLFLSVDNAIALTLENNLDIAVARYQIPFSQADPLRARAGGATRGVANEFQSTAQFAGAVGAGLSSSGGVSTSGAAKNAGSSSCCDPVVGFSFGWDWATTPLNTTALTGVPFVTQQTSSLTGS